MSVGEPEAGIEYRCTAGHPIEAANLDSETECVSLDKGARVRICREHGCPISATAAAGCPAESMLL